MVLQAKSALRSASAPAAERAWATSARTYRIGLLIGDGALGQALRAELASRPGLRESEVSEANVVVTDSEPPEHDFGARQQMLRVGSGVRARPNEAAIESLDPSLILAAATVLAAGYRVVPEAAPPGVVHLSSREKQVVDLLVEGASNKLIARELDISVHTAKFHVTAVLEKLGARNRSDAVAIALREGLVML